MRRIAEGYFHRVNPFNYKQVTAFSLLPEDVDGMVFWKGYTHRLVISFMDYYGKTGEIQ